MIENQLPPRDQINRYFDNINQGLATIPELKPALELATKNPELAVQTYETYVSLIDRMAALTEPEKECVNQAKQSLLTQSGETGSASKVSATDLLNAVDDPLILSRIARSSSDPTSAYFDESFDQLVARLEGGHQFKLAGKTPSDNDPESNKIIWGHTQITDPEALLNFTICHYLERYFAKDLSARGIKIAEQKDFLLNALIDVVIVDHLSTNDFDSVFKLWDTPKTLGGMGWITLDRLNSYTPH